MLLQLEFCRLIQQTLNFMELSLAILRIIKYDYNMCKSGVRV